MTKELVDLCVIILTVLVCFAEKRNVSNGWKIFAVLAAIVVTWRW